MAWFKVDDGFWSHPKTLACSPDAIALWVRAGAWSCQQLTDGFIPKVALGMFGVAVEVTQELVDAGYWSADGDGWRFHDWEEFQESSDVVKSRRERARERMRKARGARSHDVREKFARTDGEVREKFARSSPNPDPTRPDPTIVTSNEVTIAKRKLPEVPLPNDWAPTARHVKYAQEHGIDLAAEVEAFRLHAETHDRRAARWNGAFSQWLSKAKRTKAPKPFDPYNAPPPKVTPLWKQPLEGSNG